MFNDHKEVCFVTNVFPESMNSKVYRLQRDGLLREQSVPPPLPVYNKYMCAVDVTGQIRKYMGSIESQGIPGLDCFTHARISPLTMHIYFINTIVCKKSLIKPKDQHAFRLEQR